MYRSLHYRTANSGPMLFNLQMLSLEARILMWLKEGFGVSPGFRASSAWEPLL